MFFTPNLPELLGWQERYDVLGRIPDNVENKIPTTLEWGNIVPIEGPVHSKYTLISNESLPP